MTHKLIEAYDNRIHNGSVSEQAHLRPLGGRNANYLNPEQFG